MTNYVDIFPQTTVNLGYLPSEKIIFRLLIFDIYPFISKQPVLGTDYTIALGTSGWTIGTDGYYYYDPAVPSGSTTANLINSLVSLKAPQGYTLAVDILADAIQATPIEAVREAWPASGR